MSCLGKTIECSHSVYLSINIVYIFYIVMYDICSANVNISWVHQVSTYKVAKINEFPIRVILFILVSVLNNLASLRSYEFTFIICKHQKSIISNGILKHQKCIQFSSVPQSCLTLCDPMNRSTPGLPVHHQLLEFTQTHVHRVSDAIQPSHPLPSPSSPAPNPSQHQSIFKWVNSLHEVAKVLEFQL